MWRSSSLPSMLARAGSSASSPGGAATSGVAVRTANTHAKNPGRVMTRLPRSRSGSAPLWNANALVRRFRLFQLLHPDLAVAHELLGEVAAAVDLEGDAAGVGVSTF